jgi:serine/threonine protein kinase
MESAVIGGRYRLETLVASGGVASVFQANDRLLDRPVAVKLLKETTDCEEDRARFLLETQTLARLSHAGLVTMLDAGTSDGRPYLVMELVDGPSMSAVLGAPMDLRRAAGIGAQVAAALDYAHGQGVVHRDVKPGNVLLRSDGRVKLADFGIARLVGQRSEYTKTGVVVGSVHYLAPEQVAFEEITPAVDVYALGMLLIRAVTGQHAFDGPTIETALARLSATPEIPHDLPGSWRTLLTAMTARQPADRPTAAEVAEQLTGLSQVTAPSTAMPPRPIDAPVGQGPRRRRLRWPAAVAAAVLAVALLVTGTVAGWPGEDDRPGDLVAAAELDADPAAQQPVATGTDAVPISDVATSKPSTVRHPQVKAKHHQPKAGHAKPAHKHKHKHKHKKPKHKPHKGKH